MAEDKVQSRQQQTAPPKEHGLFISLFWLLPWKVIGILLAFLFCQPAYRVCRYDISLAH